MKLQERPEPRRTAGPGLLPLRGRGQRNIGSRPGADGASLFVRTGPCVAAMTALSLPTKRRITGIRLPW